MKKLLWAVALAVGLSQASGCIIESSSDDGSIIVDWILTVSEGGDIWDTCFDAGIDIVEIEAVGTSRIFSQDFNCERFEGEIFLPPDDYAVDLIAYDDVTGREAGRTAIPGLVPVDRNIATDLFNEGPFEIVVGIPALRGRTDENKKAADGLTPDGISIDTSGAETPSTETPSTDK